MIDDILQIADAGAWVLMVFYLLFRFEKILTRLADSNKALHSFLKNNNKGGKK